MGLANRLARLFPACRTNVQKAALKIHARVSLPEQEVQAALITGERVSDGKAVSVGKWVKDRLVLFDLGYLDYGFLKAIREAGGAFCSRLKTTSNAIITAVREGCSNAPCSITSSNPWPFMGTNRTTRMPLWPLLELEAKLTPMGGITA